MRAHQTIRRAIVAVALSGTLVAAAVAGSVGSAGGATPATTNPVTAAGYAGRWLAASVTADGFVPKPNGDPSPGGTLQAALALATAGVDQATFAKTVTWLGAHVDDVTGTGTDTDAGNVGYLLLVVDAAGQNPNAFGGVNLVSRLTGTISTFNATTDPGLYGAADPTYDGTFRQGVAILGLEAAGASVPAAATNWLLNRQCGTSDPLVRGAWESYRLVADACTAGDPVHYSGVDTNSTALAAGALVAAGVTPTFAPLPYFQAVQNPTGGWGYVGGLPDDPNSDGVVMQAIVALGGQLSTGDFVQSDGSTPYTSLLSFQLGCDTDPADQGAFTFPGSDNAPNALATEQAIWGAMARPFPLAAVTFVDAPVPCVAPPTTTVPGATTTTAIPGAVEAVEATPAFTG